MQCNELEQILEQHSDGPLPELANSHMNGCEACRALAADLEAIHTVAAGLGAEEIAPPEHIWITLRNQLEAEGIIREPVPVDQSARHGWWFAFQRPALAAAPAQDDRVEKHFPVQSKHMVTVRNASGRIQVKTWGKHEMQVAWTNAG